MSATARGPRATLRAIARVPALGLTLLCLMFVVLLVVLCPLRTTRRRMAQQGLRWVCRVLLAALGVSIVHRGPRPPRGALVVANHLSWLDIPVVLSAWPCAFVAKREVRRWPLIGRVGDALGVIWIDRRRPRDLLRVVPLLEQALARGEQIMLFPEGTTTDGQSVLPFRSGLYEAAVRAGAPVYPVALSGQSTSDDADALCWYADETLFHNLPRVAALRGAQITVHVGAALSQEPNRKALARCSRAEVVRRCRGVQRVAVGEEGWAPAWAQPARS